MAYIPEGVGSSIRWDRAVKERKSITALWGGIPIRRERRRLGRQDSASAAIDKALQRANLLLGYQLDECAKHRRLVPSDGLLAVYWFASDDADHGQLAHIVRGIRDSVSGRGLATGNIQVAQQIRDAGAEPIQRYTHSNISYWFKIPPDQKPFGRIEYEVVWLEDD
jgi:hypothetical protein